MKAPRCRPLGILGDLDPATDDEVCPAPAWLVMLVFQSLPACVYWIQIALFSNLNSTAVAMVITDRPPAVLFAVVEGPGQRAVLELGLQRAAHPR